MVTIIDGTDMILGRLASGIAKRLIKGEEVHLINCEKIIISGKQPIIMGEYLQRRRLQQKATPEFSPKWPKSPNLLVRRIIRGMLPFKKAKGKAAFKRLRVYIGAPELKGDVVKIDSARNNGLRYFMPIGKICKQLGASW